MSADDPLFFTLKLEGGGTGVLDTLPSSCAELQKLVLSHRPTLEGIAPGAELSTLYTEGRAPLDDEASFGAAREQARVLQSGGSGRLLHVFARFEGGAAAGGAAAGAGGAAAAAQPTWEVGAAWDVTLHLSDAWSPIAMGSRPPVLDSCSIGFRGTVVGAHADAIGAVLQPDWSLQLTPPPAAADRGGGGGGGGGGAAAAPVHPRPLHLERPFRSLLQELAAERRLVPLLTLEPLVKDEEQPQGADKLLRVWRDAGFVFVLPLDHICRGARGIGLHAYVIVADDESAAPATSLQVFVDGRLALAPTPALAGYTSDGSSALTRAATDQLERMIQARKLPLMLDLDQTILHQEQFGQRRLSLRPGAAEVLKTASHTHKIYINCAGHRNHLMKCMEMLRKEHLAQYIEAYYCSRWACEQGTAGKDVRQSLSFCVWAPLWHLATAIDDLPGVWRVQEEYRLMQQGRDGQLEQFRSCALHRSRESPCSCQAECATIFEIRPFEGVSKQEVALKEIYYLLHKHHYEWFQMLDRRLGKDDHRSWTVGRCELPHMEAARIEYNKGVAKKVAAKRVAEKEEAEGGDAKRHRAIDKHI